MRYLFLSLLSVGLLTSCSKDNAWTPEDDINDFLETHPYGVIFDNDTNGDLYIICEEVSENTIIVKRGVSSDAYHTSKSRITISYSGEGTHWTEKTDGINLVKDEVIHYTITYP